VHFFDDEMTASLLKSQAIELTSRLPNRHSALAPANDLHTLISSNDLATRLGVSRATVLRAVARGLLRPAVVTPGGHHRFLPDDVELPGQALKGLITSREAARLLGISQQTLNRAAREGRLRAASVTPGGHRRFAASDIADLRRAL
jgi:excisionase family DNA binding protein